MYQFPCFLRSQFLTYCFAFLWLFPFYGSAQHSRQAKEFTSLKKALRFPKRVKVLNLGSQDLKVVPEGVARLSSLEHLDLSGNSLSVLPAFICQLKKLKVLLLHRNDLTVVPDCICSLDSLEQLQLADNQLGFLPDQIGRLQALHLLWIHNNRLKTLPSSFSLLPIEKLAPGGNDFDVFPIQGLQDMMLKSLDLSGFDLGLLPPSSSFLPRLESVSLVGMEVDHFPPFISRSASISQLYLSNCKLPAPARLFASLHGMPSLSSLTLNWCGLRELPESLGKLEGLTHLFLAWNQLDHLPAWLFEMPVLYQLSLKGNPFPEELLKEYEEDFLSHGIMLF